MLNIDRHIAISAGWVAGPAFGVAMMAAPEYLHLGPIASAVLFWAGIIVFLVTIAVVVVVSIHEEGKRKAVLGPIVMMALGALIFCGGAAWYFWPTQLGAKAASEPERIPRIEDFFAADFNRFLSVDRTVQMKMENPADGFQYSVEIRLRLFRDFDNNTEFFAMLIPFLNDARAASVIEGIIENIKPNLKQALQEAKLIEIGTQSPGGGFVRSADLVFSGRVFLYTINALDPIQIGRLVQSYRNDGMYLEIRGTEYLYYHSKH